MELDIHGDCHIVVKLQWLFVASFGFVLAGVGLGSGGWPGRPKRGLTRLVGVDQIID